jgi:hypothetical protein
MTTTITMLSPPCKYHHKEKRKLAWLGSKTTPIEEHDKATKRTNNQTQPRHKLNEQLTSFGA